MESFVVYPAIDLRAGKVVRLSEGDPNRQTTYGDANLDGAFNSRDLVLVFQAGEYEDRLWQNSTWATGDWDGDGDFETSDVVLALQRGNYDQTGAPAGQPIPEPPTCVALSVVLLFLGRAWERQSGCLRGARIVSKC